MARPSVVILCWLLLLTGVCRPAGAETPEQLRYRLERYRQQEADAAKRAAEKREQIERQKAETYARTWRRYGDWELNVLNWKRRSNGVWATDAKYSPDSPPQPQTGDRFDDAIGALLLYRVVTPAERARVRSSAASQPQRADQSSHVAVDCASLTVNTKLPGESWATWQRPAEGTAFEELLIDRCAQPNQ